jgi:hypothetical protein
MITEPKIEHRNAQPYMGIRAQVTMQELGPYEGLMQATADLLAWAEKKGIVWDKRPAGPKSEAWRARVENYLTDPTKEPDPAKWETELAFKLADDQRAS